MYLMRICTVGGCDNKHEAKGYCKKHWFRWKRHGDPLYTKTERHGMSKTPEYRSWAAMVYRCINPNDIAYKNYGGRGITVCERWKNSFPAFYSDIGPKPFPEAEIDREENDGNYEPGNCRWTTKVINRRHTRRIKLTMGKAREIRKSDLSRKELALKMGVCLTTIRYVINNKIWKEGV